MAALKYKIKYKFSMFVWSSLVFLDYRSQQYLTVVLKNKIAYLFFWSSILNENQGRLVNGHIGKFNRQIEDTDRKNKANLTKCRRFLKIMKQRNELIHKQVMLAIPKNV